MKISIQKRKPREKMSSLPSSQSDPLIRTTLNRATFKEELKNLKSLEEKDYKNHLSQLLKIYHPDSSPDFKLSSQTSFTTPPSPKPSSHLSIPSLKIPINQGHSLSERSIVSPKSDNRSDSFNSYRNQTSLKLDPLTSQTNFVTKVGFKSRPSKFPNSSKSQNQDRIKIMNKIQNIRGLYNFIVIDGHGNSGHLVSQQVKKSFSSYFKQSFPANHSEERIKKCLLKSFEKTSTDLTQCNFDTVFSGASATSVVVNGPNLICANLGTCRAVVGQDLGQWQAIPISIDHHLANIKERKRMISMNARIVKSTDMYGFNSDVFFIEKEDVPGLSITRSFGDKIGKFAGMLSIPDICCFTITANDKFLVIATENFWKVLSPLEAVCVTRIGWSNQSVEQACDDLIEEAERKIRGMNGVFEDLTVIVVFFINQSI
jgi:serine/threonine protein phosphatase PrpC